MAQIKRRHSRVVKIGSVSIGGNNPVAIQSMTKCKTSDYESVLEQVASLAACGCDIVRLAVKDISDAKAIRRIKQYSSLPLVADIHFNWKFALEAIDSGVDKIRLNPGNIYRKEQIREVVASAKAHKIPIRVGLNSGSVRISRRNVKSGQSAVSSSMVKGALDYIKILEGFKFYDIVLSLKGSDVFDTISSYRKVSELCDYPLHLGTTATGGPAQGIVKSSIAIGSLLLDGIGDTIRVSLTDCPEEEVRAARNILQSLYLRNFGPEIISCPTCGRCEINLVSLVRDFEQALSKEGFVSCRKPVKVALMGCVVNGPGEAKESDIGIAFGRKDGLIFKKGRPAGKVKINEAKARLLKELRSLTKS